MADTEPLPTATMGTLLMPRKRRIEKQEESWIPWSSISASWKSPTCRALVNASESAKRCTARPATSSVDTTVVSAQRVVSNAATRDCGFCASANGMVMGGFLRLLAMKRSGCGGAANRTVRAARDYSF